MNIGKILWLGGYNKKLNEYNKFGFIRDIFNYKDLYFNLNDIDLNSGIYNYYKENGNFIDSNKFKSDYVCYSLEKGTNTLKDIRLCRETQWNESNIEDIKLILQTIKNPELRNLIIQPCKDLIMENEEIFKSLDIEVGFQLCITALNEKKINKEYIIRNLHFVFLDLKNKNSDVISYYKKLPNNMEINEEFFGYLDYIKIFELLWETKYHGINYWWKFNIKTKIKYIYRLCYSYDERSVLISNIPKQLLDSILFNETNKLVKGLLYILAMKYNKYYKNFLDGHNLIQEYVIEEIKNNGKVNLYEITPLCYDKKCKVDLCEGKLWRKNDRIELHFSAFPNENIRNKLKANNFMWDKDRKVWFINDTILNRNFIYNFTGKQYIEQFSTYCPRTRTGCEKNLICKINYYGSNYKMDWKYWNLLDLINDIGFEPKTDENYDYREYVYKLNGWINRLIEITERLKCSKCRQVMKSNFEYSKKFTAVYNNTVAYCPSFDGDKEKHDANTYLNHCNGCGSIIDSRESRIQQDDTGFYLCIKCGRGMKNHPTFKEGDKCPKCGKLNMNSLGNRIYKCSNWDCSHTIKAPHS